MKKSITLLTWSVVALCGIALMTMPSASVLAQEGKPCPSGSGLDCGNGFTCAGGVCTSVGGGEVKPAPEKTASPAGTAKKPDAKAAASGGGAFQLQIGLASNPKCLAEGNCSLDDIVATGASAANLLTALSGALFLVAFIYGGFMYLISFGDSGRVTAGKNAMKMAAIGMVIVLGAYTIVSYVVQSLGVTPPKI